MALATRVRSSSSVCDSPASSAWTCAGVLRAPPGRHVVARRSDRGRASTPAISSSSCSASSRPSVPSSTTWPVTSSAIRRTISSRCGDQGDVADGDEVLDLQRGQRARHLVQARLVPLEGGDGLVGAGEQFAGAAEDVAALAEVEADDPHRLRHRDDRVAGLAGDPLRGAVPGAGLLGRDGRVGHQVGRRPHDARSPSLASTTAPSILHSSRSRVAENSTSSGKPPVHRSSTARSQPSTTSAPVLPRRIRSSPSRSSVPGATVAEDAAQRLVVLGRRHVGSLVHRV